MRRSQQVGVVSVAAIVAGIVMLVAGFLLGASPAGREVLRHVLPAGVADSWLGAPQEFSLQSQVLDRLESTYYEEFDPQSLQDDAIRGMLAGLDDPYTSYFDPQEYAELLEHTEGTYSGVGMVVEVLNGFPTIVSTFKGSPAEGADLQPGDIILKVNGEAVDGIDLEQVVARIKGAEGSTVAMELYRPPAGYFSRAQEEASEGALELPEGGETVEVTMTRRAIEPPVLESQMLRAGERKVAHIRFFTFSDGSAAKLRQAVTEAIEEEGAQAIILDLRSNGGGLVNEAVAVASIFVPEGVIVTTEGLHSPREELRSTGGAFADIPLYVLVNEFTASASEIVAGALKDYQRAEILGTTTFGKGLVQVLEGLSNGGAVKITSAVYLTPSGADINGKGITPDVEIPDDLSTTDVDETLDRTLELIAEGG